jgi:hypothetical protein
VRVDAWLAIWAAFSKRPAVFQISRDPRGAETVVAELGRDTGGGCTPADHRIGVRLWKGSVGELARAAADRAEQRPLGI